MAEKKEMHIENIKKISSLIKDGNFDGLIKLAGELEKEVKGKKVLLEEKLKALEIQRKEREALDKEVVAEPVAPVIEEVKPVEVEQVKEKVEKTEKPVVEQKVEEKKERKEKGLLKGLFRK